MCEVWSPRVAEIFGAYSTVPEERFEVVQGFFALESGREGVVRVSELRARVAEA